MLLPVESKVPSELEQLLVEQTSKVTLPVSFASGSPKVAVRVGVEVLRRAPSAGDTSAGVDGATFEVLFVTARPRSEERRVGKECGAARALEQTTGSA